MSDIQSKIDQMGLWLPKPMKLPSGVVLPFESVRLVRNEAHISGHIALDREGHFRGPFGKVGREVTQDEGYEAARYTALSILSSLQRTLGNLDKITHWVSAFGMVNGAEGFNNYPAVINGFSDLILELFGDIGKHSRSAIGVAGLPFDAPVEIEAVVLFS